MANLWPYSTFAFFALPLFPFSPFSIIVMEVNLMTLNITIKVSREGNCDGCDADERKHYESSVHEYYIGGGLVDG